MSTVHLKLLKYLPLLSLLGFLGFIKDGNNHFTYSRFIFFGFIFAYWEYKFLLTEPKEELLNECHHRTKCILYPFAALFCVVFILMSYFSLISSETLINLAILTIGLLAVTSIFITQKLYHNLSKKS